MKLAFSTIFPPVLALVLFVTIGCTSHTFDTKNYEDSLYNLLVVPPPRGNVQDSSTSVLGQVIESAIGIGANVPAGAFADYGSLLHFQGKNQEAFNAWGKEVELHQESGKFINQLTSKYYTGSTSSTGLIKQNSNKNKSHSKRRSILIWPPFNKTKQSAAPAAFHATISDPLIKKGYYVFPIVTTKVFLKNLGLLEDQTMPSATLEKIQNQIGADAILTITITKWVESQPFMGLMGQEVKVGAYYQLLEVPSGKELWRVSSWTKVNEQTTSGAGGPIIAVEHDHRIPARALNKQVIQSFTWNPPGTSSTTPTAN